MSTIYALSSGAGRAGVAVIRVSGPGAAAAFRALAGALPEPRRGSLRRLRDACGATIDYGLALWFPAPHSFTGEDCIEFQPHGSRAVVAALLLELSRLPGCRPALPGEFSRRAFVNGRVDLIELEALADLLAAETEAQRRMAVRQAEGGLRAQVERWADRMAALLAEAEADLDFSDEDDVAVDLSAAQEAAARLAAEMGDAMEAAARSDAMRDGFKVAIVGPPNAGKSSLLNRLAGHEAAIVSDIPGTTRDAIEVRLDLGGVPVRLVDTAGLRETSDPIERLGVARAEAAARGADLTLWLAVSDPPPADYAGSFTVASQRDRFGSEALPAWAGRGVSIHDPRSIRELIGELQSRAESSLRSDATLIVSDRQTALVRSAAAQCVQAARCHAGELFAEALRGARLDLARVTGKLAPGDILDVVFGRFCIGK